jgi:hypothetical protein
VPSFPAEDVGMPVDSERPLERLRVISRGQTTISTKGSQPLPELGRELIRSVIGRRVVAPEKPCEGVESVFQLVTRIVVGVLIHPITFRLASTMPLTD